MFKCLRSLSWAVSTCIFLYWFSHSVLFVSHLCCCCCCLAHFEHKAGTLNCTTHTQLSVCSPNYGYDTALRFKTYASHCKQTHRLHSSSSIVIASYCDFCALSLSLHASSTRDRHNNFMPDLKDSKETFYNYTKTRHGIHGSILQWSATAQTICHMHLVNAVAVVASMKTATAATIVVAAALCFLHRVQFFFLLVSFGMHKMVCRLMIF